MLEIHSAIFILCFLLINLAWYLIFQGWRRTVSQAQQNLNEQTKLLSAVVANANDLFIFTKADQLDADQGGPEIVYVNEAVTRLTGYSAQELIGQTPRMLHGPKTDRRQLDALKQALKNEQPFYGELINYTKYCKTYWIDLHIAPLRNDQGVVTHFVAVQRDISQRKQAESYNEILKTIAASAHSINDIDSLLLASIRTVCKHINWPLAHVYIWDQRKQQLEPTGLWFNQYTTNQRFAEFQSTIDSSPLQSGQGLAGHTFATRTALWIENTRIESPDIPLELFKQHGIYASFALPIFAGDHVYAVAEFFNDVPNLVDEHFTTVLPAITTQLSRIVERLQADHQRQEFIQRLELSNQELEHFASVCSHDLQEPLRTITNFTAKLSDQLGSSYDDTKSRTYLRFINESAVRCTQLVTDLLAYASLEQHQIEKESIDLTAMLSNIITELQTKPEASKAIFMVDPMPRITANRSQIYQLFQNLVTNALKFARPSPTIQISIGYQELCDEHYFSVEDNGIGIPYQHIDRIFNVFQRLHHTDEYPGSGIGLAICKKVVERHGGTIWLTSAEQVGTTFHFKIQKQPASGIETLQQAQQPEMELEH